MKKQDREGEGQGEKGSVAHPVSWPDRQREGDRERARAEGHPVDDTQLSLLATGKKGALLPYPTSIYYI